MILAVVGVVVVVVVLLVVGEQGCNVHVKLLCMEHLETLQNPGPGSSEN